MLAVMSLKAFQHSVIWLLKLGDMHDFQWVSYLWPSTPPYLISAKDYQKVLISLSRVVRCRYLMWTLVINLRVISPQELWIKIIKIVAGAPRQFVRRQNAKNSARFRRRPAVDPLAPGLLCGRSGVCHMSAVGNSQIDFAPRRTCTGDLNVQYSLVSSPD